MRIRTERETSFLHALLLRLGSRRTAFPAETCVGHECGRMKQALKARASNRQPKLLLSTVTISRLAADNQNSAFILGQLWGLGALLVVRPSFELCFTAQHPFTAPTLKPTSKRRPHSPRLDHPQAHVHVLVTDTKFLAPLPNKHIPNVQGQAHASGGNTSPTLLHRTVDSSC